MRDGRVKATRETATTEGTGTGVALLMQSGGVGDAIHAFPAISVLAKSQPVTVFIRGSQKDLWQYMADAYGISLRIAEHRPLGNGDFGEIIDYSWMLEKGATEFATVYSLFDWCTWDMHNDGSLHTDTMLSFAEIVGVELPTAFDFAALFSAERIPGSPYVLTSLVSNETWRSYTRPEELATELARGLYVENLAGEPLPFGELVSLAYNASCVVAVDNGVLALATALGVPTVSLWSVTGPEHIHGQFSRFLPVVGEAIQGPTYGKCESPCYRQRERGFDDSNKEGRFCCGEHKIAWCLHHITPQEITEAVHRILQSEK